jgi:hypothetical protein
MSRFGFAHVCLLADHLRAAIRTDLIYTALAGQVRLFVAALGTDTIPSGVRAGLVTAASSPALTCSRVASLSLPAALAESIA